MATTFEPIATVTLSVAGTFDFTGIPATYTDLRLVIAGNGTNENGAIRFNGDDGANYGEIFGVATSSDSKSTNRYAANTYWLNSSNAYFSAAGTTSIWDIFNYSNTSYFKVGLNQYADTGTPYVQLATARWASTAAINRVTGVFLNLDAGSTITLFGIKAA